MALYLSRLQLNPKERESWGVFRDVYDAHRRVMAGFPDVDSSAARSGLNVLWRFENRVSPILLVQSAESPLETDWQRALPGAQIECKRIDEVLAGALRAEAVFSFRMVANPSRKIDTKSGADGKRRHGQRVPLRDEASRVQWLRRRLEAAGAQLIALDGVPDVRVGASVIYTGSNNGRRVTVEGVDFEGRLVVAQPSLLLRAIVNGIGPGKAFGMGLLTLARP